MTSGAKLQPDLARKGQRRLNATAPVVTRYFASRLGLSRAGTDAGSTTWAKKRRAKAAKAASWPIRSASGIAIRHSDPELRRQSRDSWLQRGNAPLQRRTAILIGQDIQLRPTPFSGT